MTEIRPMASNEVHMPSVSEKRAFDPDKRIDVNHKNTETKSKYDVDKRADVSEREVNGGAYSDVKKTSDSNICEVNHIPADAASYLERNDGPAIKMEIADHRQTASWGRSREACEYRAAQKELIDKGRFREAVQMDIDDIKKIGSKYDGAIAEMLKYVDKLEAEGKIK